VSSVLDNIRDNILLNDDESIETFPESNIVRVTGTSVKCESAVKLIKETLQNIARTSISITDLFPVIRGKNFNTLKHVRGNLELWANRQFDDATLRELGKLTNSFVTKSFSKSANQKKKVSTAHSRPFLF
jgi:hypothetical protein